MSGLFDLLLPVVPDYLPPRRRCPNLPVCSCEPLPQLLLGLYLAISALAGGLLWLSSSKIRFRAFENAVTDLARRWIDSLVHARASATTNGNYPALRSIP